MSIESEYLEAFEVHDPAAIRAALDRGASATEPIRGEPPIFHFLGGYLRSDRLGDCLRVLLDAGASLGDPILEAILLDDREAFARLHAAEGSAIFERRYSLACAFTQCDEVTPLHLCVEFARNACGAFAIEAGADLEARAGVDADGFGGQTPIFHAVNSILDQGRPLLERLVAAGARTDVRVDGIVWGRGADWETLILDPSPITYAQCGLLPQFHRDERSIAANLALLWQSRTGRELPLRNVPNRYLAPRRP
ncbi:MAG: hypothetical protein SFX72_14290 [Isosphaeraceae bacterium]|nr:hypothetical protein [Isosphaeraceae bacterium]